MRKRVTYVCSMLQNCTDDIYFKHHVFSPQRNSLLLLQLKGITSKLGNISKSKTCDDCVAWMPGYTIIFSYHTGSASLKRSTGLNACLFSKSSGVFTVIFKPYQYLNCVTCFGSLEIFHFSVSEA